MGREKMIIGTDECGLGSIAGPVVAAAVVLRDADEFPKLRDSKKMTPSDREWVSDLIKEGAEGWAIAGAHADKIDRYGISACRWYCMAMCVNECLKRYPDAGVIVDGNQLIAGIPKHLQAAVVGADDMYQAVSAASVLAKVYRDHIMVKLWQRYPYYDWKRNSGYGTAAHMAALRKHGVSRHHRKSYAPVEKQMEKEAKR